jgi:hypothetical protein
MNCFFIGRGLDVLHLISLSKIHAEIARQSGFLPENFPITV